MTKLILFGDSLTAGYESGVTDFRVNEGIEREFYDVEVINAGIPGDTTKGAVLRVESHVLKYKPDLVVVFFGANDVALNSGVSLLDYKENLTRLIKQIGFEKVILIGGPFTAQEEKYGLDRPLEKIKQYSQMAEIIAEKNQVVFIDLFNKMLENENPNELLQQDGLHFSKKGYQLLISLINQAIKDKREG